MAYGVVNYDRLREDLIYLGAHCDEFIGCEGCPHKDEPDYWCQNYNEHDLPNEMLLDAVLSMRETFENEVCDEAEHDEPEAVVLEHNAEHEVDMVEHPPHYELDGLECIDVMEKVYGVEAVKHFCLLNAFKYLFRTTRKNGAEDVSKAIWYLNKWEELNENE